MKRAISILVMLMLLTVAMFTASGPAGAGQEVKMIGTITKIIIASKTAKTATVLIKNTKTSQVVEVTINDELTLDKFKDHRIVEGDEVRVKYEVVEGKNVSKLIRKTAGC